MNLTVLNTESSRLRGVIGREPESPEDVFLFTEISPVQDFI